MVSETIRTLVIDDDALVRAGLKMLLGGAKDIEVVGEGADGDEAMSLVRSLRPDVVLMDIRMPRINGLEATRQLMALGKPPRVIILTTFDADDMVLKALSVGASGFLLKDTSPQRMVESIRQVAAGEYTLSPSVVAQVIAVATRGSGQSRRDEVRAQLAELTDREQEVAVAIGQGLTNAQIAASLYMSMATVKTHVTHILEKLGVTNRVQIAILVRDAD